MSPFKTFRISFALKNTYRVNTILFSLKQIPLIKKLLPGSLYRSRALKILAGVIAALWEVVGTFIGKLLYFVTMVCGIGALYETATQAQTFLHILLFLTAIGTYVNTSLFNPTRDKYYATILMRMDARTYTLVNYAYSMLKVVVGFLPFTLWFGTRYGLPLYMNLLLPLCIAGMKVMVAAFSVLLYEKKGVFSHENNIGKVKGVLLVLFLAAAYGLPAAGLSLPIGVSAVLFALGALGAIGGVFILRAFQGYREVNQQLLAGLTQQMDERTSTAKKNTEKAISTESGISSQKTGFEYLNELFVKRHKKILWRSSKRLALICLGLVAVCVLLIHFLPLEERQGINTMLLTFLPYFVFIMYAINRGTGFTQALFMNCDHSLLTYSFYKRPAFVLRLFSIRLREIIKVNLLPAAVIGGGLALLLLVTGGSEQPLDYVVLVVSILCMSIFFSIHYLTIYYLLQPYNAGTEIKSGTYKIILWVTYGVCYALMQVRMPIMAFGLMTIVFCVLYSVVSCILVYRLAPKTFKLRL